MPSGPAWDNDVEIVLTAGYDLPASYPTGEWLSRRFSGLLTTDRILLWGGILPVFVAVMLGAADVDGAWVKVIQLIGSAVLLSMIAAQVDRAFATNAEAADDQVMVMLAEWCAEHRPELQPLFELIQEYRRWSKLKTTYIDGYLRFVNPATGRIHPDLMPLATETGRFAARNPNMQNCPRKTNDPVGIRSFIVAPEGHMLVSCDFSQIELRVGAFYCRDEKMLETYRTGGDIHAQTTSVIFGIPFAQAVDKGAPDYKERRIIAKNCNFGVFYGLFPSGLQKTLKFKAGLDMSKEACAGIIDNLKSGYPHLTDWQDETKRRAANTCYAETWLGRRRYIIGILSTDWGKRSFAERCAMNTPTPQRRRMWTRSRPLTTPPCG